MSIKVLASRGKYKIAVDADIHDVAAALKELGYHVFSAEDGIKDNIINQWLQDTGIKYFITNNYDDFAKFPNRSYFVIGTQRHHEPIGMARIIERYFMKFRHEMQPGLSRNLDQKFVNHNLNKG